MDKDAYKAQLEKTADRKPTRLERRLAEIELVGHEAAGTFENADLSSTPSSGLERALTFIWQLVVLIFVALATIAALIPSLIWIGITMIPALLLLGCFSQF